MSRGHTDYDAGRVRGLDGEVATLDSMGHPRVARVGSTHSGKPENPATPARALAIMPGVDQLEVILAHRERATLRVGDVFLKIDTDQERVGREVGAMAMAPIPVPEVLWHKPPVLALAALPGRALGRPGEPSPASAAAWAAAGAAARMLHDAPPPSRTARSHHEIAASLDSECEWLVANDVLPAAVVTHNRRIAEAALRPWTPVFTHGDLHVVHVFVADDKVTGVLDWSEAAQGDALFDLAVLTVAHPEHLDHVIDGYGGDVDVDVIRAWWSVRCLLGIRWLTEHGFDPWPEVAVLTSALDPGFRSR